LVVTAVARAGFAFARAGFDAVRFAASFLRGVERPVGTVPAFAVAAAPLAARDGVAAGFGGLSPAVRDGGTVASFWPP
jgi:hypothetical protein